MARSIVRPLWLLFLALTTLECRQTGPRAPTTHVAESPEVCQKRQAGLVELVRALPTQAVASPTRVDLPASSLGAVPGPGALLEISETEAVADGALLGGATTAARASAFATWAESWATRSEPAPLGAKRVLYVAASAALDVQAIRSYLVRVPSSVELRLLVRTPSPRGAAEEGEGTPRARELAQRLLTEPAFEKRKELAREGYAAFARCSAVTEAVTSVEPQRKETRWPALQSALSSALPGCDCAALDTASLRVIVSAEQRAGASALGWVPLSFLRDERCGATMPLRSARKLVGQMEQFDQQFAGGWQRDALHFEEVITSERLGVHFCDALPGETLAAKQRAQESIHFKLAGAATCDEWVFEPLAPGSPYGTIRRAKGTSRAPLAFHYRQAAEELRLLGPIESAASQPTDEREWKCDETLKMTGIDEGSITLDKGRWFFAKAACESAPVPEAAPTGCFAAHASGQPLTR